MTNRIYLPHSLLLLAVALVLVSGCGENPQQHLDLGQWYYQKDLVDDAILEYKEAIRLLPANSRDMNRQQLGQLSQAYFNLAIAYARKNWYELALVEAKRNFDWSLSSNIRKCISQRKSQNNN